MNSLIDNPAEPKNIEGASSSSFEGQFLATLVSKEKTFLGNLLSIGAPAKNPLTLPKEDLQSVINFNEGTSLKEWKLVDAISARVLDSYEDKIVLECLIDKENREYAEYEYPKSRFEGYSIEPGQLFKLLFYERGNQAMMDVKSSPKLVAEDDFPKINFSIKHKGLTKLLNKSR